MATFAVILPAAGQSSRFQYKNKKKPFVDLSGRAVWIRSAEVFANRKDVIQTLVVISPDAVSYTHLTLPTIYSV